jgi:hypothetical protein
MFHARARHPGLLHLLQRVVSHWPFLDTFTVVRISRDCYRLKDRNVPCPCALAMVTIRLALTDVSIEAHAAS